MHLTFGCNQSLSNGIALYFESLGWVLVPQLAGTERVFVKLDCMRSTGQRAPPSLQGRIEHQSHNCGDNSKIHTDRPTAGTFHKTRTYGIQLVRTRRGWRKLDLVAMSSSGAFRARPSRP